MTDNQETAEIPTENTTEDSPKPRRKIGRPLKGTEPYRVNLQVRVTEGVARACRALGGSDFLRSLLERVAQEGEAILSSEHPLVTKDKIFKPAASDPALKFVDVLAACGLPSPALDYAAKEMSLNDYFVKHQDSTYMVEAQGDSMIDAGIRDGDILIIDRALEPKNGDIVLAFLHNDPTIRRLKIVDGNPELHPENSSGNYPVIYPSKDDNFQIAGVLTGSGRKYRH